MSERNWKDFFVRSIGILLAGDEIDEQSEQGERIVDDTFLILLNAYHDSLSFVLPGTDWRWETVLNTTCKDIESTQEYLSGGKEYLLIGRSVTVLRGVSQ